MASEVLDVKTNEDGVQTATVKFVTVAPWISTSLRLGEQLLYVAVAAGIDYVMVQLQAGKTALDPLTIGVISAMLASIAKFVKEKGRDDAIQEVQK